MAQRTILLEGMIFSYELVKSRRKSISIRVTEEGEIQVKAPSFMSVSDIEKYILQKEHWIAEHVRYISENREKRDARQFVTGETLLFKGKELVLIVHEEAERKRTSIRMEEGNILLQVPAGSSAVEKSKALEHWYREQARILMTSKVQYYAPFLQVRYADIRIKDQKSRWGSCSSRGNLNFNWHIVLAPEEIADYLAVHELCHLRHMNHSQEFWKCVEEVYPDYKAARRWLKENGQSLKIY